MHQFAREIADGGALFRALISTSVDGIMVIDARGTVLVYSDACARLFGYGATEVLGNNVRMLMPQPYHAEHDGYLARYGVTGEKHIIGIGRDVTGRRKDGSTFPMYLSVGEGELDGQRIFVGIVHDISSDKERDRRIQELQDGLLHATRLTAMGQMSSAIAHELNQPLGAVMAYAGAMQRLLDLPDPPLAELKDAAMHAGRDAERAGQIIRRLRSFVEKREAVREREALGPLVTEAIALASPSLKTIGIVTQIPADLPELMLDRVQIQQVLVNLLRNAAEATADSSSPAVTIAVRREGRNVLLSVGDNGHGIEPAIAERLFQPFITSKTNGMGMGLNICRTIVEAHGGRIWAENGAGAGAVFHISLPAHT
jgi:two-component system sensor kinase FixL